MLLQALHVSRAPSFGAVLALWQVTPGLRFVAVVLTCHAWPSWPVAPVDFSILELMSNALRRRTFDMTFPPCTACARFVARLHQGSRRLRRRDVVYSKDTRRQPQYPEDSLIVTYRIWARAIYVSSSTFVLRLLVARTQHCTILQCSHSHTVRFFDRLLIVSISSISSQSKTSNELLRFSHPPSPW